MLSALNTLDSKAAYLIQMIALELYKACKEMNPKVRLDERLPVIKLCV